jgi:glycosyltransferase involved in cell wall biosynthesis
MRLLILSLARNCAAYLPGCWDLLAGLAARGVRPEIVIGENGSTDGTRIAIERAAAADPAISVIDTGAMAGFGDRLRRMAHGRQLLLDHARRTASGADFVAILDIDDVLARPPEAERIVAAMAALAGRDDLFAISASSAPYYYDLLALRCPGLFDENIQIEIDKNKKNPVSYYFSFRNKFYPMQKKFSGLSNRMCTSAFNGLCIYKSGDYFSGSYERALSPRTCEHVAFNLGLHRTTGRRILVSPDLVMAMPREHGPQTPLRFFGSRLAKLALARFERRP